MVGRPAVTWQILRGLMPPGGRADVGVAVGVIAIVLAMVLPMPTWLLDTLIALSMCLAVLILVTVVQIRRAVDLSVFPALLLMTTLLRIALNVASSRLILLEGDAGHIIQAFGDVVVGGNIVVGLVVFVILTVVQFMVITKGSERVAEVGARFTLDAMPGKQMAIDMELRAGTLTPELARQQREALGRESQFFGAMDGAMKFVKGDAIAGVAITLANLVGGMAVGVLQRGMPAAEAGRVYSVLSIGDALVAQIPAILLSLTAGLLITRVAGNDQGPSNIGSEIVRQMMALPKAWVTASMAMVAFGLLPGMPTLVFLGFSGAAFAVGARGLWSQWRLARQMEEQGQGVTFSRTISITRPLLLRVGQQVSAADARRLFELACRVRNELVDTYALVLPEIALEWGVPGTGTDFEFCEDEVPVVGQPLRPEALVVTGAPSVLHELAGAAIADDGVLASGWQRLWLPHDPTLMARQDCLVQDYWSFVAFTLRTAMLRLGPRHVTVETVRKLVAYVAQKTPEVAKELERVVPVTRIAEVLRLLIRERVPIRNVPAIFDCLLEWGARERETPVLYECVRAAIARQICAMHAPGRVLTALLLATDVEEMVRGAIRQTSYGDFLALDDAYAEALLDEVAAHLVTQPPQHAVVVLCAQDVRSHLFRLLHERFSEVAVLATNEVPTDFKVQVIGVVKETSGAGA